MPPRSSAGRNIRALALKRRLSAIQCFASAALIAALPFLMLGLMQPFLKPLLKLNPSLQPLQFPGYMYGLFFLMAALPMISGISFWQDANRADQGAKGEEDIADLLKPLEQEGWQFEYGIWLPKGLGDVDIVCLSPQSNVYVIDVKSHQGDVYCDHDQLSRRFGNTTYRFEKDFLHLVMQQALAVKRLKQVAFVTPILAFSRARIKLSDNKVRGVYVVDKARLLPLLRSLTLKS